MADTTETHAPADADQAETPAGDAKETPASADTASAPPTDGLPDDPAQLKALVHKLRSENAKDRTEAKAKAADTARQALINDLGKALGLITDDDPAPTVEGLTQSLTQAQDEAALARAQLAVYKAAQGKADADALLDSQAFNKTLAAIDLADETAIREAIDQFVADHPRFKPAQVAGASSVEHPAGSGEGTISLDQFKAMTGEQRNELYATNPSLYRQLADKA